MPADLSALRRLLADKFPDAMPRALASLRPLPSGIASLDAALPEGGFPRGILTAWMGTGGVATAGSACAHAVRQRLRAIWVDVSGRLSADSHVPGVPVFRFSDPVRALQSAESLLQSGGCDLLVFDAADCVLPAPKLVRLSRRARAGSTALLAILPSAPAGALRVHSRLTAESFHDLRDALPLHIEVSGHGPPLQCSLSLPILLDERRLSLDSRLADRRSAS